jgi:hypothetical protein
MARQSSDLFFFAFFLRAPKRPAPRKPHRAERDLKRGLSCRSLPASEGKRLIEFYKISAFFAASALFAQTGGAPAQKINRRHSNFTFLPQNVKLNGVIRRKF